MKAPRKTSVDNDGMAMLAEGLFSGSTDGIIEGQEERGQISFAESDTLPTQWQTDNGREILERAGVVFHEQVEDDELFTYVTLPDGWKKEMRSSYWTWLLDDKGRARAGLFYKAAFYDRRADGHLNRRFNPDRAGRHNTTHACVVLDVDKEIFRTDSFPYWLDEDKKEFNVYGFDTCYRQAVDWLDEHYPDWKDQEAYWEDIT